MIYYILAFTFGASLAFLILLKLVSTVVKEDMAYQRLLELREKIVQFRNDLQHHDMEEELLGYTNQLVRLTEETSYMKRPFWEKPKRFHPWKH